MGWQEDVDAVWARSDELGDQGVMDAMDALAAGLPEDERAQCTLQLASSIRNLGRADEALAMMRAAEPYPPYAVAHAAMTALALASLDRPLEGLSELLSAVAPTLPRYQRSMAAYAEDLLAG